MFDPLRILSLAAGIFSSDLAVIQAHAAELVAEEERDARGRFVGPELLYRLEHTAALHLIVGGLLLRRVDDIEAAAEPVIDVSTGRRRRLAPMRRRHGRWRVLARAGRDEQGHARYRCRCWCGDVGTPSGEDLRSGASQSCGCLRDEKSAARNRSRARRAA